MRFAAVPAACLRGPFAFIPFHTIPASTPCGRSPQQQRVAARGWLPFCPLVSFRHILFFLLFSSSSYLRVVCPAPIHPSSWSPELEREVWAPAFKLARYMSWTLSSRLKLILYFMERVIGDKVQLIRSERGVSSLFLLPLSLRFFLPSLLSSSLNSSSLASTLPLVTYWHSLPVSPRKANLTKAQTARTYTISVFGAGES